MPRLVGKLGDDAVVVAIGGACVMVEARTLDAAGHCATAPSALRPGLVSEAAVEPGFAAVDEPMPDGLLSAAQITAILEWEVGFVEGVPGDTARPGLSAAEAELYLRYRPDTGDQYPNGLAVQAVDRPFSLDRMVVPPADSGPTDPAELAEPLLIVQLCASMIYVDDLSGAEIVADAAEDLIDRMSYAATVQEFYPALAQAVSTRTVPDAAVDLADGFEAAQILDFLDRLVAELDRRRPWPDPALVSVDPAVWPSMGASRPIGWVDIAITDLEWAVKAPFGDIAADDLALLVLRMRGGQLVALLGEEDPNPERFLVLLPDLGAQQDAGSVIAYLERYAGLTVESDGLEQALAEVAAQ
ncbi:hypothetical protein GFY24_18240 [Nocardia sp. SYP-A9097]|uniref:hypothetical protein n=1 Tax=Nocardia sp. SYP-A9097 TaxID=2663237 RepID=UPI00129BAE2D|nr:hypothetical protein [Nocardia sp. SYP-A9097]MRH89364.1 hypothetical protein [Nocardia sp. SYP-A9097]